MEREDIIQVVVKIAIYIVAFVIIGVLMKLPSCGDETGKPEYCQVSGCPNEASVYSPYCYNHKCRNHSCENKNYLDGYCKVCLERAMGN